jgi:hypothetical protein
MALDLTWDASDVPVVPALMRVLSMQLPSCVCEVRDDSTREGSGSASPVQPSRHVFGKSNAAKGRVAKVDWGSRWCR